MTRIFLWNLASTLQYFAYAQMSWHSVKENSRIFRISDFFEISFGLRFLVMSAKNIKNARKISSCENISSARSQVDWNITGFLDVDFNRILWIFLLECFVEACKKFARFAAEGQVIWHLAQGSDHIAVFFPLVFFQLKGRCFFSWHNLSLILCWLKCY